MSIDVYSPTPASNDLANYFQTGMAPSKVKIAGWDIMADLADYIVGSYTTGGSANAQTLTQTRPIGALKAGLRLRCIAGFTNTGAATFAPDGLTAKNIFANGAAALAGQVVSGAILDLFYDGTQWNLLNPSRVTGSFTITLTGMTAGTTGTVNYAIEPSGKLSSIWTVASIIGTSNATTMSGTGIPNIIVTTTVGRVAIGVVDSGNGGMGGNSAPNATTWSFEKVYGVSAGFAGSGTKGLTTFRSVYPLD